MRVIFYITMCSILLCPLYDLAQATGDDWMAELLRVINRAKREKSYQSIFNYIDQHHINVDESLYVTKAGNNWDQGYPLTILMEDPQIPLWVVRKLLVEYKADPNVSYEGATPLHLSVTNKRSDLVHLLLFAQDEGAKPAEPPYDMKIANPSPVNNDGMTPLHLAAQNNLPRAVTYILDALGADANVKTELEKTDVKGFTPLHYAALDGAREATEKLLERKPSIQIPFASGKTPIHIAAEKGYSDIIRLYKQYNYDMSIREAGGDTPLVAAAAGNSEYSIWQLLTDVSPSNQAQINQKIQHRNYRTALHVASIFGHYEAVYALLNAAKDKIVIDKKDESGDTPLMLAAEQGHSDVVGLLLENGSDPNETNEDGNTALHKGVFRLEPDLQRKKHQFRFTPTFQYETVTTLLSKGASPYKYYKGETPFAKMISRFSYEVFYKPQAGGVEHLEIQGLDQTLRAFLDYAPDLFLSPVMDNKLLPELEKPILRKLNPELRDTIESYIYLIRLSQSLTRLRAAIV